MPEEMKFIQLFMMSNYNLVKEETPEIIDNKSFDELVQRIISYIL